MRRRDRDGEIVKRAITSDGKTMAGAVCDVMLHLMCVNTRASLSPSVAALATSKYRGFGMIIAAFR